MILETGQETLQFKLEIIGDDGTLWGNITKKLTAENIPGGWKMSEAAIHSSDPGYGVSREDAVLDWISKNLTRPYGRGCLSK